MTLKSIRLTRKRFEALASPALFTIAFIASRRGPLEVFKILTTHSVLQGYVRTLIIDDSWFDPEIVTSDGANGIKPITDKCRTELKVLYKEQERIISTELEEIIGGAIQFLNLKAIIFQDLTRQASLPGDN